MQKRSAKGKMKGNMFSRGVWGVPQEKVKDMIEGNQQVQGGIAKDMTVTGMQEWSVKGMSVGHIIRRELWMV